MGEFQAGLRFAHIELKAVRAVPDPEGRVPLGLGHEESVLMADAVQREEDIGVSIRRALSASLGPVLVEEDDPAHPASAGETLPEDERFRDGGADINALRTFLVDNGDPRDP